MWQNNMIHLNNTVIHLENFLSWLNEYRLNGFESALRIADELADTLDIEKQFKKPRLRRARTVHILEKDDYYNQSEIFRSEYFNIIIDKISSSISIRFEALLQYKKNFEFFYNISELKNISCECLLSHCKRLKNILMFQEKSDIDYLQLFKELKVLCSFIPPKIDVKNSLKLIVQNDLQEIYPNEFIALRIILTIPVTVASAERSFSRLKLIKTYLRSTLKEDRLNSLAILLIENDQVNELDYSQIIESFSSVKSRKAFL